MLSVRKCGKKVKAKMLQAIVVHNVDVRDKDQMCMSGTEKLRILSIIIHYVYELRFDWLATCK